MSRPRRAGLALLVPVVCSLVAPAAPASAAPAAGAARASEVYRKVSPSVVLIEGVAMNPYASGDKVERSAGSGFLVDASGLVVTNSHVVFGQQVLAVTLDDGTTLPARVVGADPVYDIAVIRIPAPKQGSLPVVELGDSSALDVGDEVFAIGNPFGLEQTLTRGIVSALNRLLPGASWSLKEPLIQTDAAINHGSSGGPIVDGRGLVVGMATAILPEAQSIGFAIPIDLVKKVLPELEEKGRVVRPWLGVQGQLVPPPLRELLKVPLVEGFLVEVVEPGSPAAELGVHGGELDLVIGGSPILIGGDIITAIDGRPLADPEKVAAVLSSLKVGATVELSIYRDAKVRKEQVKLVERPVLPMDLAGRTAATPVRGAAPAWPLRGPRGAF